MRPFERRAASSYPYFKLACWDERSCAWRDGRKAHPDEASARADATRPGKYRVSRVDEAGRTDLPAFQV